MAVTDSFDALAAAWADDPVSHEAVLVAFDNAARSEPRLWEHRQWCEQNAYGFGHSAFHGVWHLLAKSLPSGFKFLEVGVHRGQSLSAVALAATIEGKDCTVYGLSPFDGYDGDYYEKNKDYRDDVLAIFAKFTPKQQPFLIKGLSEDATAKAMAYAVAPFDAVYVDAEHSLECTRHDLRFYGDLVREGGVLFSDDSAVNLNLPGWHFRGFQGSSDACDELLPPKTPHPKWQHISSVMHLRIWRKNATSE